jgi:hypothetical protein
VRTVRSFRAEEKELDRYNQALERMYKVQEHKGIISAIHLLLRRVKIQLMITLGCLRHLGAVNNMEM